MNLTSCDICGVVLDKDKLEFPGNICDDEGIVDTTKTVWVGRYFVPKVSCPVCGGDIT